VEFELEHRAETAMDGGGRARSQTPLNDQIHQKLRWNLVSGIYTPGQRLSTRTLARDFGTSAMPVREALKRLVAERILVVEPNSAFRVPFIDRKRGLRLFEIRKTLEILATRYAVPHLTREQVDLLRKVDIDMAAALEREDAQGYFAANYTFHFLIYSAADSPDLVAMIEGLWMQIGPFYASILDIKTYNQDWRHQHVIEAIRAGDTESAVIAIARDIDSAKDYFVSTDITEPPGKL
jgi:DNA-binding GntR family transcriptional regulator